MSVVQGFEKTRKLLNFGLITAGLSPRITYIHTMSRSRFIPEGIERAFQIFFRDSRVLPNLLSYGEYCRYDWW
jgi:hypothetical protein